MKGRTIKNPIVKDEVTFIETAQSSNGQLTCIEVKLAPSGGNELHFHDNFVETFEVLEGELTIKLEKTIFKLKKNETKSVSKNQLHYFKNTSVRPVRFLVKIEPANQNFEAFLAIMYGLARDGLTNKKGIPKSLWHIGVISAISETYPPKWHPLHWFAFFFSWLNKKAIQKGVKEELYRKYVYYQQ